MAEIEKNLNLGVEDGFVRLVMRKYNLTEHQAVHLVWSSWRKFRLILAKDRKLREKIADYLDLDFNRRHQ